MKIVCLLGSPREKGNSATIANRFCNSAEGRGAEVKTIRLIVLTVSLFLATCSFGCGPTKLELIQQKYDQAYRSGQISTSEYLTLTSQLEFQRDQILFGISPDLLNYSIQQKYINQWSRPDSCDIFSIHHGGP